MERLRVIEKKEEGPDNMATEEEAAEPLEATAPDKETDFFLTPSLLANAIVALMVKTLILHAATLQGRSICLFLDTGVA